MGVFPWRAALRRGECPPRASTPAVFGHDELLDLRGMLKGK
jgi:hypothetical protein